MRGRDLAGPVINPLAAAPHKAFAGSAAWETHLAALGLDQLAVEPNRSGAPLKGRCGGNPLPRLSRRYSRRIR